MTATQNARVLGLLVFAERLYIYLVFVFQLESMDRTARRRAPHSGSNIQTDMPEWVQIPPR